MYHRSQRGKATPKSAPQKAELGPVPPSLPSAISWINRETKRRDVLRSRLLFEFAFLLSPGKRKENSGIK
jgi:hypothetical protein